MQFQGFFCFIDSVSFNYTYCTMKKHLSYLLLMLLSICIVSCGKDEKPPTLTLAKEAVNFKSNADNVSVKVNTDADSWSATVASEGQSWCTATPRTTGNSHSLEIAVAENPNKDVRETTITVSAAGVDSKTIKVAQLGFERAILVSTSIFTVDQIGGSISFQVTTNVDNFKVVCDDWISEKKQTRAASDMITTDHSFSIKANSGDAQRVGKITIQDVDSEVSAPVSIVQKGMGSYASGELTGIKDDIKVKVIGGEASSYQGGSNIDKSYDGDYSSIYHSNWSNGGSNYWPMTLTYYFNNEDIDYLVYYPRQEGYNGFFKETEIYAQYDGSSEFVKIMDKDFKASSSATRVTFDSTLHKTTAIRFILKNGHGDGQGFASCSEMEFYTKNLDNFNSANLFTDATCTELKAGVTEEDIEACDVPFYKKIAYYMYANKYPREFRIEEFRAYQHPNTQASSNKTNAYSLRDNPTGISVASGEDLIVFVGNTHGRDVAVLVQNLDKPGGDGFGGTSYPLVEGFNKIKVGTKGLLYVQYYAEDFDVAKPIKMHFATGKVNGYYDVAKHQPADWDRLLNSTCDLYFDVVGKYAHLTFPVHRFKSNTPDGQALIDAYDEIVRLQMDFMGLFKYNKVFNNRSYLHVMYHSYMYATSYHTAYNDETLDALTNVQNLKTGGIWGPAHEIGHCNQTRPGLLWAGTTEVTNNIFSMYVQRAFGNPTRLQTESMGNEGTNRYEKAMNSMIVGAIPHGSEGDVLCKLVPFWQLQLIAEIYDKRDLYKDVYEDVRVKPANNDHGQNQLDFVTRCCDATQLNLIDFFKKWGWLTPIDAQIDDYGVKTLRITQDMIDATIAGVNAKGYQTPDMRIEYLTDNNQSMFTYPSSIVKGTATHSAGTITLRNWKNVVACEVYKGNDLVFVSPEPSFKIKDDISAVRVFAVSAKGDKEEVKF